MKKILLGSTIIVFCISLLCIGYVAKLFYTPYTGENKIFKISPGEGFSSINHRLDTQGIISSPRLFHKYTQYSNALNKFKAGSYKIEDGMFISDVLDTLTKGKPILTSITISEGKNMFQIGKKLEEKGITQYTDFIEACRNKNLLQSLNIFSDTAEGYLFPETYKFAPETPAYLIVKTMTNEFYKRTKNINFSHEFLSKADVVNLASIVEKETGAAWERPIIAGVYLNRLKKKMRLQADPTTIYGIWEKFDGNLRRKHLLQKTEYNTYKMQGLPRGPIANPSLAAIKAVLSPQKHNFIYFVSKNDGTHVFTPTYKEHLKAVNYWQKNYRNRKGKSWRDLKK